MRRAATFATSTFKTPIDSAGEREFGRYCFYMGSKGVGWEGGEFVAEDWCNSKNALEQGFSDCRRQ